MAGSEWLALREASRSAGLAETNSGNVWYDEGAGVLSALRIGL